MAAVEHAAQPFALSASCAAIGLCTVATMTALELPFTARPHLPNGHFYMTAETQGERFVTAVAM
jgi:hypothetical protein